MSGTLSVCILAYNAEALLPRVLAGVAWADEIVVAVDSKSTDATEAIARAGATRVELVPYRGDTATKRHTVGLATGTWVFVVDADEIVPPELASEVRAAVDHAPLDVGGFEVNRLTYHLGRWIRHGDFYPDWVLRIARRSELSYVGRDPHGRLSVRGRVERLVTPLEHYSYRDLAHQIERIQFFSDEAARALADSGHRARRRDLVFRPPARFLRAYVLKRGFLDGTAGFILAAGTAFHVFLKYAKLWERERGGGAGERAARAEPERSSQGGSR